MPASTSGEIAIVNEADIILVRRTIRESARAIGFNGTDITRIVTATSELARNIYKYAHSGTVRYSYQAGNNRKGISISFSDQGPGIIDIEQALQPGYSTSKGLGMGLSGSKKLMDTMQIESAPGKGTTVIISKWLNN